MSRTRAVGQSRTGTRGGARPGPAAAGALRFVTSSEARVFSAPWGRHWVLSEPVLTGAAALLLVRVAMPPGAGHQFHTHPENDEIIYVIDGIAEQWVDRDTRLLHAGDSAYIPRGVVHATYNPAKRPLTFLAILSPAASNGPFTVDCCNEEPWRRLRRPLVQGEGSPTPPR